MKKHIEAKRTVGFEHKIRRELSKEQMEGNVQDKKSVVNRTAVLLVHSDYTPSSGPKRVRDIMKDEAEELLKGQVAFFNAWKPLSEKVEELPLAMCDVRTSADVHFLAMKLKYRERTGEIFVLRHSPKHE